MFKRIWLSQNFCRNSFSWIMASWFMVYSYLFRLFFYNYHASLLYLKNFVIIDLSFNFMFLKKKLYLKEIRIMEVSRFVDNPIKGGYELLCILISMCAIFNAFIQCGQNVCIFQKSCIREKLNLLTDADSITIAMKGKTTYWGGGGLNVIF